MARLAACRTFPGSVVLPIVSEAEARFMSRSTRQLPKEYSAALPIGGIRANAVGMDAALHNPLAFCRRRAPRVMT